MREASSPSPGASSPGGARAPLFEGGVLVDFERGNAFTKVNVKTRVTEWDFDAAAKVLGVKSGGELAEDYRALLVGE